MLQASLEHRGEHHVEGNEASHRVVLMVLSRLMRDLQNGSFITLDLGINVLERHEGVKYVHDQLELIGNEGIVINEFLLVGVFAVAGRQVELGIKCRCLLVIELAQFNDGIFILVKDTLLGNVFRIRALQSDTGLETPQNLAVVIAGLSDMGGTQDFCEILLGCAAYPSFLPAVTGECGHDLLELEEKLLIAADELANLIDEEKDPVVLSLPGQVGLEFETKCLGSRVDRIISNLLTDYIRGEGSETGGDFENAV